MPSKKASPRSANGRSASSKNSAADAPGSQDKPAKKPAKKSAGTPAKKSRSLRGTGEKTPPTPSPHSSGNESKPTCHRKRVPLAEAFRIAGIDEHKIAEGHVEVYGELTSTRRKKPESAVKLILEVLKEWTRVIVPPPRNADRALLSDAPSTVELVHTVARPVRSAPPAQPSEAIAASSA
jgi:hypothetical protein